MRLFNMCSDNFRLKQMVAVESRYIPFFSLATLSFKLENISLGIYIITVGPL